MLFASNAQVNTSSTDKMMDFDNILDIASQNQGVSNVQVPLSFALKCLTLNDINLWIPCHDVVYQQYFIQNIKTFLFFHMVLCTRFSVLLAFVDLC